jgi:hypothetical protein
MTLVAAPAYIALDANGDQFQHPVGLDRNMMRHLFVRPGITRPGGLSASPVPGSLALTIGDGAAAMPNSEQLGQGYYFAYNIGDESIAWPAPSSQPRIDTLCLRVFDPQYGSSSTDAQAYWDVVQGVPAASPVAHADADFASSGSYYVPGSILPVYDVRVNPGDTQISSSNITQRAPYCNTLGFTPLKDGSTYPAIMYPGETFCELDTMTRTVWTGSTLQTISEDSGAVTVSLDSVWNVLLSCVIRRINGVVHFRGLEADRSSSLGQSVNSRLCTMPVGFRVVYYTGLIGYIDGQGIADAMLYGTGDASRANGLWIRGHSAMSANTGVRIKATSWVAEG